MGGRGNSAARNTGNTSTAANTVKGNPATTEKAQNSENSFTFLPKDLKTERDRYGDYYLTNDKTSAWSRELSESLKKGDQVTIEKTLKDGKVQSTTLTITEVTKVNPNEVSPYVGYRGPELTVTRIGDNFSMMNDFGHGFDRAEKINGIEFAELVHMNRSKIKEVRVSVNRRKK